MLCSQEMKQLRMAARMAALGASVRLKDLNLKNLQLIAQGLPALVVKHAVRHGSLSKIQLVCSSIPEILHLRVLILSEQQN
jgi:hypothetical protein